MKIDLDVEELHLLVSHGYAIRAKDAERWTEAEEKLLTKLRAARNSLEPFKSIEVKDT